MADAVKSGRPNGGCYGTTSNQSSNAGTCSANTVNTVMRIAAKRRQILSEMRVAIGVGDRETVFNLAKKLTGLSDETGHLAD